MSGKVGIYTIFDSKQITRTIYSDNGIFNGYNPYCNNKLLLTTAVTLEDTIIKIFDKENMLDIVKTDKELRVHYIKLVSMRIYNIVSCINSFDIKNISSKFILILESLVKMETLFKETNTLNMRYNIYDILSMIGLENTEYSLREIKKIKSIETDNNGNIIIPDIKKFMREYERMQKINTNKLNSEY